MNQQSKSLIYGRFASQRIYEKISGLMLQSHFRSIDISRKVIGACIDINVIDKLPRCALQD